MAGNRQGHHRHIGGTIGPGKGRIGTGGRGHLGRIGLDAAQEFRAAAHLGQFTALVELNRPPVALADHLAGQQAAAIQVAPEGKRPSPRGCVERSPLTPVQERHPHLHQRLQQFRGVLGNDRDKECVATRPAFHGFGVGGHLGPSARGRAVAGLTQDLRVGQGDAGRQIPRNGELLRLTIGRGALAGLPDPRQIGR